MWHYPIPSHPTARRVPQRIRNMFTQNLVHPMFIAALCMLPKSEASPHVPQVMNRQGCGWCTQMMYIPSLLTRRGRDVVISTQPGGINSTWCQVKEPCHTGFQTVWFHLYEMSRIGESVDTDLGSVVAGAWGRCECGDQEWGFLQRGRVMEIL